jgi:predicted SprT family Zn-dependent metalloprotease
VFQNQIPSSTVIQWNSRLTRTAGQTMMTRHNMMRTVQIQLSSRVIDKEERLQSTLLHEMCHAAQFLLENEEQPAHGPGFQKWCFKLRHIKTFTVSYMLHSMVFFFCVGPKKLDVYGLLFLLL